MTHYICSYPIGNGICTKLVLSRNDRCSKHDPYKTICRMDSVFFSSHKRCKNCEILIGEHHIENHTYHGLCRSCYISAKKRET